MKRFILSIIGCFVLTSCSQNFPLDKQGREDLGVCFGACTVSSAIREDAETLKAFQKASKVIDDIIKNDSITRNEFKLILIESLSKMFPHFIVNKVVDEIMEVYDENQTKIHENEKLMLVLLSTKSAIDSGIDLALKTGRPVRIIPKN